MTHLACARTGARYDADALHNLSEVGAPLLARYDLDRAGRALDRAALGTRPPTMWRYREVMPIRTPTEIVSLGEGWTPLHRPERLGRWTGFDQLYIKDESPNPTGSFKARGLSAAVTCARARGAKKLAIPTAGNAGGALAAYAAACGLSAIVFMPRDTPVAFVVECRSCGAEVELVDGLISDCGRIVGERKEAEGWFEVSTLKEPYRIEGKKTLGLRAGRADGLVPARRGDLSHWRGHGADWDVEGIRRAGGTRLDWPAPAADDLGTGRGLCADCPGFCSRR